MSRTSTAWGVSTEPAAQWAESAACLNLARPDIMWPISVDDAELEQARRVCRRCPLQTQLDCMTDAADRGEWDGVRGGHPGWDRKRFHEQGLSPAQYPKPVKQRECASCNQPFEISPNHRWASKCPPCVAASYKRAGRERSERMRAERNRSEEMA